MVTIRVASITDAQSILRIYTPYVLGTAFTFETEILSLKQFEERMARYLVKYPWLVIEIDNRLAGYVYGSLHREREAYQWTCESSIYLDSDFKGKGIGKPFYLLLFQILKKQGFRNVYAGITIPNEASEALHRSCGFEKFAEYHNIGFKLGGWHKVGWWRLQLNAYDPKPAPPLNFSDLDQPSLRDMFQTTADEIERKLKSSGTG